MMPALRFSAQTRKSQVSTRDFVQYLEMLFTSQGICEFSVKGRLSNCKSEMSGTFPGYLLTQPLCHDASNARQVALLFSTTAQFVFFPFSLHDGDLSSCIDHSDLRVCDFLKLTNVANLKQCEKIIPEAVIVSF
jgi:hypothetical protein